MPPLLLLSEEDIESLLWYQPRRGGRLSNRDIGLPVSQNIVCTYSVGTELNLSEMAANHAVSIKTPDFSAATVRIRERGTVQAFQKGRCVVMGGDTISGVILLTHLFRFMLLKQGVPAHQGRILMRNRVCNGKVGFDIDVKNFKSDNLGVVFQEKLFPGIVFFVNTEDGVRIFLLFGSGNFIVMGLHENRDEQAYQACEYILPILMKNKLQHRSETGHINRSIQKLRRRIINDLNREECDLSRTLDKDKLLEYLHKVVDDETMIEKETTRKPGKRGRGKTIAVKEEVEANPHVESRINELVKQTKIARR